MIRYTASSQWDALLDVAAQFTKVDRRVNDDIITSGDEGTEEPFIENDELESRFGNFSLLIAFLDTFVLGLYLPR